MKISTKGRYALRLLCDLAIHGNDKYTSLKDIAERQGISKKYLEQIVALIGKTDLLITERGHQGGYKLGKPAEEITALDVLNLTEGSVAPVACLDCPINNCERKEECLTLPVWEGLHELLNDYFANITIKDIIEKRI